MTGELEQFIEAFEGALEATARRLECDGNIQGYIAVKGVELSLRGAKIKMKHSEKLILGEGLEGDRMG